MAESGRAAAREAQLLMYVAVREKVRHSRQEGGGDRVFMSCISVQPQATITDKSECSEFFLIAAFVHMTNKTSIHL